ncbi:MAG TPA: hypothetical protein VFK94_06425 [Patescibacteria group bacterium]|nr:hypothetical protein [Patescibacteria group bacterium]
MALLFCDSFDHYDTSRILLKWTSMPGACTIGAVGRNGTSGLNAPGSQRYVTWNFLAAKQTVVSGFAWRANSGTAVIIWACRDAGTTQVDLRYNSAQKLEITRNGTVLATGATTITTGVFNYIEVKVKVASGTSGTYEVRINGVVELISAGANTQFTANATCDSFLLGNNASSGFGTSHDFDDVYLCDTLGTYNTDFLGDIRVQALLPNAAGNYSQWTPTAGANYTNVDENPPNDDTDYVASSTVGQIDTYGFSDLTPTSGFIRAVQFIMDARKDDAGTRQIAAVVRQSGADYVGVTKSINASYAFYVDIMDSNPATSTTWTLAEVNADEFGIKVIA